MDVIVFTSEEEIEYFNSREECCFLIPSKWNDWFRYETTYILYFRDPDEGITHHIGPLKIGQFNMGDKRSPSIYSHSVSLPENCFSLGQDDSYYYNLNKLGIGRREEILILLNDIAKDAALYEKVKHEDVTKHSLLRYITETTVTGQFRRMSHGGARLTEYAFTYTTPKDEYDTLSLSFKVDPESNPPTNIHVLIGRNGVGKTYLIENMIRALASDSEKHGVFKFDHSTSSRWHVFPNLVYVSFSAFDVLRNGNYPYGFTYIGLKKFFEREEMAPKRPEELTEEFVESVQNCIWNAKGYRWRRAIEMLETDPIFKEAEIGEIQELGPQEIASHATEAFLNLSSGHKIVLLTITRLVERVEEKSFVLIDEPEVHLHPPLLSAFIRALSALLIDRNGVAIIATHSPVILQEVPKRCIWKIRKNGTKRHAERLEIESFGENVGTLTQEIFGLEVTNSGFHTMLTEMVRNEDDYETILSKFKGELGLEARAILKSLLIAKKLGQ